MVEWNYSYNAGLRPALFFKLSEINFDEIECKLKEIENLHLIDDKNNLFIKFQEFIFFILDELWAPIIIYNISKAKLFGKNKKEKYKNFFLDNELKWTQEALCIKHKYKLDLEIIKNIIIIQIKSFLSFLDKFIFDYKDICLFFNIQNVKIADFIFNISDLHNYSNGCILIKFDNNKSLIYKPKSAHLDLFIQEYIKILKLKKPFNIKIPKIACYSGDHYWQEFIKHTKTNNKNNLSIFYKNFGSVLAVMDSLNYSDGHSENFIASQNKLIPIDLETLFINYSYYNDKANFKEHLKLAFTGIIPFEKKQANKSTLRNKEKQNYFPVNPTILNEGKSDIMIKYRVVKKNKEDKSFPSTKNINLLKYQEDIKKGMNIAYFAIQTNKKNIINLINNNRTLESRQIIRPTLYYKWLIYKFLHPLNKEKKYFLNKALSNYSENIVEYEKRFIFIANVPVFYNRLNSKNLFGYQGEIVKKDYFSKNSFYWIKNKIEKIENNKFINNRVEELFNIIK